MLPDGTGGGATVTTLEVVVAKNPKKALNESPTENRRAVAGETGFVAANPSGSCGVVKKLAVDTNPFATDVLIVKIDEANLAEKVSEEEKVNGTGGAAFGAGACGSGCHRCVRSA